MRPSWAELRFQIKLIEEVVADPAIFSKVCASNKRVKTIGIILVLLFDCLPDSWHVPDQQCLAACCCDEVRAKWKLNTIASLLCKILFEVTLQAVV